MIIGCTGNYRKQEFYNILEILHNLFKKQNIKFIISSDLEKNKKFNIPSDYKIMEFSKLIQKCDILFAIGGDGTILSTVRRLKSLSKPIMGIHIGGLGFLSECTESNLESTIKSILNNKYVVSERMLLELQICSNNGREKKIRALNDIVVEQGSSARLLKVEVEVSKHYLNTFEGDGVIFSTPTGSTAYSLSAGGPIIYPSMDSITITPICPHSLSARPIVIRPEEVINLAFPDALDDISLVVDGQIKVSIKRNSKIRIIKAKHNAKIIRMKQNSYFKTLRTKMGWIGNVR
tara:strand:- start:355 stop:1227 length:873 start_codon:yes stop_codon:yes gene_type:complete